MRAFKPVSGNRDDHLRQRCAQGAGFLKAGRADDAVAAFADALRVDSNCAAARFGLAECHVRCGRLDEAIGEYVAGLQADPGNAGARYGLGSIFLTKGKIDEAIRQFAAARAIDPEHAQARFATGKCLEKSGHAADALQEYLNVAKAFPGFIDAYLAAAGCLVSLGRAQEAVDVYRKAVAKAPGRADVRKMLIRLLEDEGRTGEAIAEYREILAAKPDAIDIRRDLASALDRSGLIREAIEEYARIMEIDPLNAFAHRKHAALVRERAMIDRLADRYLGDVIRRMETIGERFREGMKLYIDGCYEDALGEFAGEVAAAPGAEACFGYGACLVRAGDLLAAVPRFREAARLQPDFKEAHTMLGILYERHGLLYEASEEYEKGLKAPPEPAGPGRKADGRAAEPSYRFYKLI